MRRELVITAGFFALSTAAAQPGRGGTRILPGQECPAGTTEVRPNLCRAPEIAPPSILDYRPKSTLVTAVHLVPRSKFPSIDFHGHPGDISTAEGLERLGAAMDSIGVQTMIAANNISGEQLNKTMAAIRASTRMKDRVRVLTGINFRDVGPGWAERTIAQLEADAAAGAVGVGEIGKGLGLSITKPDGSRLKLDDPELKPVWDACARLGLPVFIHTADPQEFFKPQIDLTNERWLELALFPSRRFPPERYPSFETLVTERDNLFRNNPRTTFVTAHMGWEANNLAKLGKLLSELPNVYTEVGAVLYDIGRQPRGAHEFFIEYQDRVLFGKDSFQPEEYPYYWRVFETADEYFDYYRGYHAFWKLYGISLPDSVLKKVYYQNALKLMKGVPAGAFPK